MKGSVPDAAFFLWKVEVSSRRRRILIRVEGIADGSADAQNVIGVKVDGVIDDAVEMGLGSDKKVSPHAVLDAAAHVQEKVIAVKMGGAA